jgi:hypothetical protein
MEKRIRSILGAGEERTWIPDFLASDRPLCHRLTAFVFAANPKSQKNGSPGDRVFAPTNVDARTKWKGAERELRNTAAFATEDSRAKRHPRPPDPLLPSKLATMRRAHTHRPRPVTRLPTSNERFGTDNRYRDFIHS